MHELSIAQALIEQVEGAARGERGSRITAVSVRIGGLSGVDEEALRAVFPLAAEGTSAAGAELRIENVPLRVACRTCGAESTPESGFPLCERCGGVEVDIAAGRDLLLVSIELRVEEPDRGRVRPNPGETAGTR